MIFIKKWLIKDRNKNKRKSKLKFKSKKFIKFVTIIISILLHFYSNTFMIIVHTINNTLNINVNEFLRLRDKPINGNDSLILKEKESLLEFLSNNSNHKITKVDTLYLGINFHIGNQLILLGKSIFYCEILGCKRILLKNDKIFIKNKIYYEKYNITIEICNNYFFSDRQIVHDFSYNWLFYFSYIRPEIRLDILKEEILDNLPKLDVNPDELFIHIRSGDIFKKSKETSEFYSQPPLCFYETILRSKRFGRIFIISENKLNPIIDKLILKYPDIIYNENKIDIDIAYLVYAYNIVGSISTFINMLIRLNDNLKYFWEYNLQTLNSKIIHCHHSFFKPYKNITYYTMEPSEKYKLKMEKWNCTDNQLEAMINEICTNTFSVYYE